MGLVMIIMVHQLVHHLSLSLTPCKLCLFWLSLAPAGPHPKAFQASTQGQIIIINRQKKPLPGQKWRSKSKINHRWKSQHFTFNLTGNYLCKHINWKWLVCDFTYVSWTRWEIIEMQSCKLTKDHCYGHCKMKKTWL